MSRPRTLSLDDAGAHVGVSARTIRRAMDRGELASWRVGKVHRVLLRDLDEWVESRRETNLVRVRSASSLPSAAPAGHGDPNRKEQ